MNFICILFELHRARCMEYEPFGKYNHVLPVDHTNSPLFWIQAFLVVERACITLGLLLQSELALFEGFSFILKTRRGISCAWLSAKCPDRNTLKHWMLKLLSFIIYRLYILYVQFLNLYCVSRWSYSPVVTGWFESDTAAEMSFLRQTQRGLRYLGMEFCEGRAGSNVVCWRIDDFPCYKSQSIKYKGNFPASPVWRPTCRSQTTPSFNSAVRSSGYLLSPTHLVGCVQIISKAWCVWRIMEHSVIHSIFPELDGDKKSRNTNFDQKINGFPKFAPKPIQRPQKCADFFRWRRQPLR